MEPMTVGIMGILALFFVLVSLAAFKMLTKETTFEDVYGENAMRLFAEEKTGKQKTTKSTKSKARNADKKKDHAQEKEKKRTSDSELQTKTVERKSEEPQQIVLEHARPEKTADAKNVKQPDEENVKIVDEMPVLQQEMPKHTKKKNKNKQHQEAEETKAVERNTPPPSHEKQNVVDEPEVAVKVEVKATQQSQKKSASPAVAEVAGTEETSSASAEGVEKKAKKKRARRAEEQLHEVGTKEEMQPLMSTEPIKEQKQQVLAAKEEKKPEKEKPKPKKPAISVRDITVDKLHTRLSAVDDLEPEYLSFLAAYFSDTGALKTKLTDENATLRREVADKTKLAHQVVSDAQRKDSEIAHLKQSLTDEKKKYTLFEQSVCSQLSSSVHDKNELQRVNEQFKTEINNLKEELRKAQTALKAVPPPVDTTAFQQQVDMLRSELNNAQKKISQMEGELGQRNQVMQQMKADLQNNEARIEHMKKATAVKEQHFKESETSLKRERERLEAKLNDSLKAVDELQKLAADAIEERSASAQKAVEDCRNEYNNQLECMKQQLLAVEKERDMLKTEQANTQMLLTQKAAEQDNSHKEEVAKLNSQIAQLKELIDDEKAKLSTEKNERSKEVADLRKNIAELHGLYASEMEHVTAMKDQLQKADRAESEHKTTIARLEKDLADAKSKLAAAESSEDAELKRLRAKLDELMKNRENGPLKVSLITPDDTTPEEEVVELSKVRGLGAAPQSVPLSNGVISLDQSKLGELEQELAEQQKRNNELREANYKVVEMSQKQDQMYGKRIAEMEKKFEKSLKEERNAIVDQLQKILPADMKLKSPPQQCTQEQYKQWICDATEALKKRSSAAAKVSAPNTPKIESIPNSDSTHDEDHEPSANERPLSMSKVASTQKSDVQIEELESKVERYRVALATVSSTIDAIEHEAAQKEKHYEREIALLKKELNRRSVDDGTVHSQLQHPVGGGSLGTVQTADGGKYQHHRRRTRSGRRYWTNNPGGQENDPSNFLNGSKRSTAEQNRRRRKKCLSESAATHVTFGMITTAASGNDNEHE